MKGLNLILEYFDKKKPNINLIELEIIFGKRYTKQLSFFEIEKHLFNNYKLITIDKATNIIDNNAYSVNCLYLRNNIE